MKRIIIFILYFTLVYFLFPVENEIPGEIDVDKYKSEFLDNIIKTRDKDFFNTCYYYNSYIKKYKLKDDLEPYKIDKLKNIIKSTINFKIDWLSGRIYSSSFVYARNDSDFAANRMDGINLVNEKAKVNFYRALKRINIYESVSLLEYFEERSDKNIELFSLIDKAKLYRVEYPDLNTIKLTYYINIYGKNSLMNIFMSERDFFTEDLKSYMGYHYDTKYSGVIIDARGELKSYDGNTVNVKPSIFIVVKDNMGRVVFDMNNVYPEIIRQNGMVKFSYDITGDYKDVVGDNPLKVVASGTGDRSGSNIVITNIDAMRMLASEVTRQAIQNGRVIVIINE